MPGISKSLERGRECTACVRPVYEGEYERIEFMHVKGIDPVDMTHHRQRDHVFHSEKFHNLENDIRGKVSKSEICRFD